MAVKKHIALQSKKLSFHNKHVPIGSIGRGVAPVLLNDRISNLMGGLIISENAQNVFKGGKLNNVLPKKPIRFLV